jgi:nitrogenase molybdenum-iron protein NifN
MISHTPVVPFTKALSENPLKASAPLGAALAYLGIEGAVPLFHGSQGCTSFALVLTVRHAREAIPMQTTALDEVAAILGGADNLEQALLNLTRRMKPRFIGVASTALAATRGEDIEGDLKLIRQRQPDLADVAIAFAATPDYDGALEDGWSRAVTAIVEELLGDPVCAAPAAPRINVLAGVHQTAADIEAIVDCIESFGLGATVLPDISTSLDGTVPERYVPYTLGGTKLAEIRAMGHALHTLAVGEHMRAPAQRLHEKAGVAFSVLPSLTGLAASDACVTLLSRLSGRPAGEKLRRQRSRLVDAMLDAHFHYGGKRVAVAADPDLLASLCAFFTAMGAHIVTAVASTPHSPLLEGVAADRVLVGDLADFERAAAASRAELLVTHSHGRQAAARLGVPLLRVGFPVFDRLGATHRCSVLYAGTQRLVFEVANLLMADPHAHTPEYFATAMPGGPIIKDTTHACTTAAAH